MRSKNKGFARYMRGDKQPSPRTVFSGWYRDNCRYGDKVEFTDGGLPHFYPPEEQRVVSGVGVLLDSEGYTGADAVYYIKRKGEWL